MPREPIFQDPLRVSQEPLLSIQEARAALVQWLQNVRRDPNPSSHAHHAKISVGSILARAGVALAEASSTLKQTPEWQAETAAYREALRELRARLSNFEITLRIRQAHLSGARTRAQEARRWSELVRQLG